MNDAKDLECATLVMETILLGMRTIILEMRANHPDLTVPQFRLLAYLDRHEGVSLSDIARNSGVTLPSMSRSVDGLVKQRLVDRDTSTDDRRRIMLSITETGRTLFHAVENAARSKIAELLSTLSPEERSQIMQAMNSLQGAFFPSQCCTHESKNNV